jgi:hypothetical protein
MKKLAWVNGAAAPFLKMKRTYAFLTVAELLSLSKSYDHSFPSILTSVD